MPGYACYDPDEDGSGVCAQLCVVDGGACPGAPCEATLGDPLHDVMIGQCPP